MSILLNILWQSIMKIGSLYAERILNKIAKYFNKTYVCSMKKLKSSLWPFLENFIKKPYKVLNFTDLVISIWQCLKSALDIEKGHKDR